jgi:hypothetical protein
MFLFRFYLIDMKIRYILLNNQKALSYTGASLSNSRAILSIAMTTEMTILSSGTVYTKSSKSVYHTSYISEN